MIQRYQERKTYVVRREQHLQAVVLAPFDAMAESELLTHLGKGPEYRVTDDDVLALVENFRKTTNKTDKELNLEGLVPYW